jgi:hypothetical protein
MRLIIYSIAIAAVSTAGLAAIEPASPPTVSVSQSQADLKTYEEFYRASFRSSSIEKCVAAAPKAAEAGFDITPTCVCTTDKVLASNTLDQLIKFGTGDIPKDQVAAITVNCLKTNPPTRASKE